MLSSIIHSLGEHAADVKAMLKPAVIRRIRPIDANDRRVYLSFDDGPDPISTPKILKVLKQHQVKATFFVVATDANLYQDVIRQIANDGHSIGNHSLDHTWSKYFRPRQHLMNWIDEAERSITAITGTSPIGFRSPAGVITPPLLWACSKLNLPIVHWSRRSHDSVFPFTPKRAQKILNVLQPGDIILLHDKQRERNLGQFLETLSLFIEVSKGAESKKGLNLEFAPIRSIDVRAQE